MKLWVMVVAVKALTWAVRSSEGEGLSRRLAGPGGTTPGRLAVIAPPAVGTTFTHWPAPAPLTPQLTGTGEVPGLIMLNSPPVSVYAELPPVIEARMLGIFTSAGGL